MAALVVSTSVTPGESVLAGRQGRARLARRARRAKSKLSQRAILASGRHTIMVKGS
ncbi:MAG: hypothetical protein JWP44_4428 [Mucilaginibacter sp.]|nr:hypothetical protein [Mucilaginibacter sp.]